MKRDAWKQPAPRQRAPKLSRRVRSPSTVPRISGIDRVPKLPPTKLPTTTTKRNQPITTSYQSTHRKAHSELLGKPCAHCGTTTQPREAALVREAPVTRQDSRGRYSARVGDYIPLCRQCHSRYDRGNDDGR